MLRIPHPVILASASPRREDLLKELIPEFQIIPADIDEDAMTDPDPWITAQRLAREKCFKVFAEHTDSLVIGADTVAAVQKGENFTQYAKPIDEADAKRMLTELSGREHLIITGVCLRWPTGMHAFTDTSRVIFRELSEAEIDDYVATGEPMGKAAAYGVQGAAGKLVHELRGNLDNVIGLPLDPLREALQQLRRS